MFRGEFVPSLYLKQLYSIAINLLTLKVSEETSKDFKELHGSLCYYRQMKRKKNSTSYYIIRQNKIR